MTHQSSRHSPDFARRRMLAGLAVALVVVLLIYGVAGVFFVSIVGGVLAWGLVETSDGRGVDQAVRERDILVRACIEVSDFVGSAALREQLLDALAEAGVTRVDAPAGERFDSDRHRAVGRIDTTDGERHDRVVRTERAGYVDRGRRLRCPEVLVFNANGRRR